MYLKRPNFCPRIFMVLIKIGSLLFFLKYSKTGKVNNFFFNFLFNFFSRKKCQDYLPSDGWKKRTKGLLFIVRAPFFGGNSVRSQI